MNQDVGAIAGAGNPYGDTIAEINDNLMKDFDETADFGEKKTSPQDFNQGSIDKNSSHDVDESSN